MKGSAVHAIADGSQSTPNTCASEEIRDLLAKLRLAQVELRHVRRQNRLYARANQRVWTAHLRMSSTLERLENRRRARRQRRRTQEQTMNAESFTAAQQ